MPLRQSVTVVALMMPLALTGCVEDPNAKGPQMPPLVNASQIVVTHIGNPERPPGIKRTFADAVKLAGEVHQKIVDGGDFAELARKYSEDPGTSKRGGHLGNVPPLDLPPSVRDAVLDLKVGELSEPKILEHGVVILKREPLAPSIAAKHILISYKGSERADPRITRTKEEARTRAEECVRRIADGESFADLVSEYSDGPTRTRGGDLGSFSRGAMAVEFEDAAYACPVGKTTGVVETAFGFHIILRYR